MDTKILEVINQIIVVVIYGIVLSRELVNRTFDSINTIITIGGIVFSVILMFFIWYLKSARVEQ
jgi:hypothetical protein